LYALAASLLFTLLALTALAQAQTFTTLYNFTGGSDGAAPYAGVNRDPAGNLYGTTEYGGDMSCYAPYGCGVVYEVNSAGTETVLHTFSGNPDGLGPTTPMVRDKAGNIYGTTYFGGSSSGCYGSGCGTVFKIDSAGSETVLYSFTGGSDGCSPWQGLVVDKAGNLYGTALECGSSGYGTIFEVDSTGHFTVLHSFSGLDGAYPSGGHLTMDKFGNLYGLAGSGGAYGCGVLYKRSKNGTFTLLHSFEGATSDGCGPSGSVVQDEAGNLYGTTEYGGSYFDYGTIWRVSKTGKETILHHFAAGSSDGGNPVAGVARDSKGNLYGVASWGGANDYGVLYELRACGKLTLLHSFNSSDGAYPYGEVLRTCNGTLFGTTMYGGSGSCSNGVFSGCGTTWSYVP
jgi:uncharacterized repeat protein (TIGR03803 family)